MTYNKQLWTNGAAGGTPVSADRLNHMEDGIAAVDALATAAIPATQKGVANGVATLDGTGLIPAAQMPASFNPTLTAYNTADLSPVAATPVTVADLTGLTPGTWQVTIEGQASAANTLATGLTLTGLNGLTVAATAAGTSGSSRLASSYFNSATWSFASGNLTAGTNNTFGSANAASNSASFAPFRVSGLVRVTANGDLRVTATGTGAVAGNHTLMMGTVVRAVKIAA